ncbi:DUF1444 family protein [Alphaproteobacteria bacterium KMM 3653]|uniref:DUF1444 family protein n=1 Tax=Harenicola maris TaxID=2841044 RepID=A0AAP2CKB4_9RHOB|nr:DUF1444 family protein [Harenicola maris]
MPLTSMALRGQAGGRGAARGGKAPRPHRARPPARSLATAAPLCLWLALGTLAGHAPPAAAQSAAQDTGAQGTATQDTTAQNTTTQSTDAQDTQAQATAAETPRPETLEDTLALMRDHVLQTYPKVQASIDSEQRILLLTLPGAEEPALTYPDNLHKQLARTASAEDRALILSNFIAQTIDSPDADIPDRLEQLRPVLRHLDSYTSIDPAPVHRPFLGDMGLFYVWDKPGSVAFVTQPDLARHGLTAETLDQTARDNFAAAGPQLTVEQDGVYFLTADGFYESSFLLDTGLWQDIESQLGPLLIAVPNRSIVVFQPITSLTAKPQMRALIESFQEDYGYALSSDLLLFRDGEFALAR